MNIAQLRALVTVVEEGGFTPAAASLGLTQSAVSHAVASLERELGLLLLSRRGGVGLTANGERLFPHAREAVRRVDRLAQDAAAVRGEHAGKLRVAGFPSACQLLPPLIAGIARRYPDVAVVLLEGTDAEVADWLKDGVVDLGVVADLDDGEPAPSRGGAVLAVDRIVAVVDLDHPLAGESAVTLADLSDDPFLLSAGGCEPLLQRLYAESGEDLVPARRVHDMATLLALVAEGLGVTVVPELALTGAASVVCVPVLPAARRVLRLVPAEPDDVPGIAAALLELATSAGEARAVALQIRP